MSTKKNHPQKSFCIPRVVVDALLNAEATVYEICAYLTLAHYTEASGVYSSASIKAINTATGANKTKGGPVARALDQLKRIHACRIEYVSNGKIGDAHQMVEQRTDLGPILYDRETWLEATGEIPPDGPHERGKVRHILPDFGEPLSERVWFGSGLVEGFGAHEKPLKTVKNAGDVAARLLLVMYAATDMEMWGGVAPVGSTRGPWVSYDLPYEDKYVGGARIIVAQRGFPFDSVPKHVGGEETARWQALMALEASGLFYEVVMVLNRDPIVGAPGCVLYSIPEDAEPLYELDCRSKHGYKPKGEFGLAGITAKTAGELGAPVTMRGGRFLDLYAAIVPFSQGAMIVGIYRPRYRASNPKNAGVRQTWRRIDTNNLEAFDFIERLRKRSKLTPLPAPWDAPPPSQNDLPDCLKELFGK